MEDIFPEKSHGHPFLAGHEFFVTLVATNIDDIRKDLIQVPYPCKIRRGI